MQVYDWENFKEYIRKNYVEPVGFRIQDGIYDLMKASGVDCEPGDSLYYHPDKNEFWVGHWVGH